MQIWVAGVDEILTPEGIISPGLGDTASIYIMPIYNFSLISCRVTVFSTQSGHDKSGQLYNMGLYNSFQLVLASAIPYWSRAN